jgi:hypothetical protein
VVEDIDSGAEAHDSLDMAVVLCQALVLDTKAIVGKVRQGRLQLWPASSLHHRMFLDLQYLVAAHPREPCGTCHGDILL